MQAKAPEIRRWTIYKITVPDGGVYVGKTSNLRRRLWQHFNVNSQLNKYLKDSIIKHGWDAHQAIVLDEFNSDDIYAQGKEMFWIRSYMSNRNKWPEMNGLNQTDGGTSLRGYKRSYESNKKSSESQRGKKIPCHIVEKVAASMRGVKLPKERCINIGRGHMKALLIYDLDGNFIKECESGRDVYYFLYGKHGTSGHIQEVAQGKRANYKGYIFKYK